MRFPLVKVLVTGVGGGVGQGIIKSLRLIKDLDIEVVAADMSSLASGLYAGDVSCIVPAVDDPNYFEHLRKICERHDIDFYFPGTDVELMACSKEAGFLQSTLGVVIIVSPVHVIEIADDKFLTINFLKENGFAYPETHIADAVDLNTLKYPLIVKPRVGCRSIGVHMVSSPVEAKLAMDSLVDPIIQEYLSGDEFTCTVAVFDGDVSDVLCLKRDLRAGDTYRAFPEKNTVIEDYIKSIALKLGVVGPSNFQLKMADGVPKLFEINARFSGTTPFCAYLGFNPVEFCLKKELGLNYVSRITLDKVVLRHWCEVVVDKTDIAKIQNSGEGVISSAIVSKMI